MDVYFGQVDDIVFQAEATLSEAKLMHNLKGTKSAADVRQAETDSEMIRLSAPENARINALVMAKLKESALEFLRV